jgi:hemoglobin
MAESLYERLGGYDAISSVVNNLLPRLMADSQLERFWNNRSDDGLEREKQLLVDFLCNSAGGDLYYTGRDMLTSHKGMGITQSDWDLFINHLSNTLDEFKLDSHLKDEVLVFIKSTSADIID